MTLLECVPNLSEGRSAEILRILGRTIEATSGVGLLDSSSDPDHHRSVLTVAGEAAPLIEAMVGLYEVALTHIDLRLHRGVHPRLGVVDVVPFVPLQGATMDDAVSVAWSLGEQVAERFGLPVFFYGRAARQAQISVPADLRRLGLPRISRDLASLELVADLGGTIVDPRHGVTMIGARPALIAYNVVLDDHRLDIARSIAASIRASSGGLAAVQALGFALPSRGLVQVSCNLLDFQETGLAKLWTTICEEARRLGSRALEAEIVGMVPAAALRGLCGPDLGLVEIDQGSVIEVALGREDCLLA